MLAVTKPCPERIPFADSDHGPVPLPWGMANASRDALIGDSVMQVMMNKFVRWLLMYTAGSWSPLHIDGGGSFTVGQVYSGFKL
jgi:hypothetical protein